MFDHKTILANGCSFTNGKDSWPYLLSDNLKSNIVNLGMVGAGNRYIHDTTIRQILNYKYDLVLVMWSGINRFDFQVEDPTFFDGDYLTSLEQLRYMDWDYKKIVPIDERDRIEANWVFAGGGRQKNIRAGSSKESMFGDVLKHYSIKNLQDQFLMYQYSLQSVLRLHNIPYVFMYHTGCPCTADFIDNSHVFDNTNLLKLATEQNCFASDGIHPGHEIHQQWATMLSEYLISRHNTL